MRRDTTSVTRMFLISFVYSEDHMEREKETTEKLAAQPADYQADAWKYDLNVLQLYTILNSRLLNYFLTK